MVKRQILILFILIFWLVSCETNQPGNACSNDFKVLYQTLQENFKSTYLSSSTLESAQILKTNLNIFLNNYKAGFTCTWDNLKINIRDEVQILHDEMRLKNQKSSEKVIYGEDDRMDIDLSADENYKLLAHSVAGMILSSSINADLTVNSGILGEDLELCSSERFFHQQNPMVCTGFLVGDDVLVTAGHCIEDLGDCAKYAFVFEYKNTTTKLKLDDIYECREIISRKFSSAGADYAVVRLDRKVVDRVPLKFRRNGKMHDGSNLFVIGHPSGLPLKVASGAYVRDNSKNDYFVANLDSFGGNSGSPVFNESTKEIEGILVRGETDYTYDLMNKCYKTYKCTMSGCRGEDATRITQVTGLPVDLSPVDGGWSEWSLWSKCVSGLQTKTRTCTNPSPSNGGSDCEGDFLETRKCVNVSKEEVLKGLFEKSNFQIMDGQFYKLKRYTQADFEIVGKKFLSICALHTKPVNESQWYSYFAGDCLADKVHIEKIYDDFEALVVEL
ncbi:MAG: hypothetical protein A2381_16165 [Bdellovibrionales bacterium RIFOXYB1_FULL_37_110]|nr:MAG: hypothetical protein A2417_08015 [Bdellovibrionales bacterium RIFOXYC1_FULL_37_79]OFZ57148.1 MAG: hypothetical protein A2381_16165 [Bdellovibrionales bacterium RIFOXYB1_FULL_37_110]OFZ65368.1 MAG: hypothetical protein A2577_03705 [Bdellovibrionales bacterium RIFOXYD1_FULL_36_51]OFZ67620.1 MAG: hypothetical protein A2328_08350 [Bdellovibrionales bacterium RIFOXYB2_FULL_36_6]